ncbi:hypothetical protein GOARA_031_00150 [Gordonia araii NBRC 100433]|uniref:Glycosyltransferase RgtA/B/C/D-like domain-containing protein n=1 Tax=Gordonia araii NBRC 100433 TaxID=1073574 RepID=G7H015_9ACTN|nr:hypothetical protein [Gordonia araii]GAB09190.1 hypothetical protein GOARA_031_00150 [Gordonia araii NBRC 100433]
MTTTAARRTDVVDDWVVPILTFFAVRLIGVAVLARLADLRGTTLPASLRMWDGKWMLAIAQYGYEDVPVAHTDAHGIHTPDTAFAFFPGYPYLVGVVAKLPGLDVYSAAIIVTLASGALAAVAIARIGRWCAKQMTGADDDQSRTAGLILSVLFAAAPMGIVLSMAYTEALFCALVAWSLVGVVEKRWLLAGLTALLAGTVRPTGIVLIGVVMLAAFIAAAGLPWGKTGNAGMERGGWRAWAAFLVAPLGYLGYLGFVWRRTGTPMGWFDIQTAGWGTKFDGGRATFQFVNQTLVNSGGVVPVATALIIVATLVLVGINVAARTPWPLLLYGVLVVASIVLSSGLMMSRARLLLPAFVLLIPIANYLSRQAPAARYTILGSVVALSSWFGAHILTVYPHAM